MHHHAHQGHPPHPCCCAPHQLVLPHVVVQQHIHQYVVVNPAKVSDTPARRAARRNRKAIHALAGH